LGEGYSPAVDEPTPREGGPKTWVVLALTAAAAVLLAGALVGWRAWRDDGDDVAPATEVPTSVPETTNEGDGVGAGGEMVRRTTDAGIELRMQRVNFNGQVENLVGNGLGVEETVPGSAESTEDAPEDPVDLDGNGRPDVCDPVGDLAAWAIADDVVLQGNTPWTEGAVAELYPSAMFGGMLQPSFLAVVMQVDLNVRSVRLTSPAGAVDVMEPVGGAVVLAVPVPEGDDDAVPFEADFFDGYQLIAERGDGVVQRADWDSVNQGHPAWGGPGPCMLGGVDGDIITGTIPATTEPVELPEPGAEQPPDVAAAEAEIETNFASLYGNPVDGVDRSGIIDDASGLEVARQQVQDNGFGDEADSATVTIQDLVFVSASEALFRYTLTTSAAEFADQFGRARLLDGVWKITRGTLCQDMEKAGAICPP